MKCYHTITLSSMASRSPVRSCSTTSIFLSKSCMPYVKRWLMKTRWLGSGISCTLC